MRYNSTSSNRAFSRPSFLQGVMGAAFAATLAVSPAHAADPIKIGLVTALSGQSARAGEALTRGATIAIEEINAKGGVLGRPLELVRRDDESNPAKGLIAARELIQREKVSALLGGLDTPVALADRARSSTTPRCHSSCHGLLAPTSRRTAPADNYVFRVSAMDDEVDKAIVQFARKTYDTKKPGLILVNNPWGESNEHGLKAAMKASALSPPASRSSKATTSMSCRSFRA